MQGKKTGFYYYCMVFTVISLVFIFAFGLADLGTGWTYSYLPKGLLLLGIFIGWILCVLLARIAVGLHLDLFLAKHGRLLVVLDYLLVIGILVGAAAVRLWAIRMAPPRLTSDSQTFYEIARLLWKGNLQSAGQEYCEYIALFPHAMGYCFVLKNAIIILGDSVLSGQYLNIALACFSCFFVYKIGRKLGGRLAGYIALVLCAFWPSQILAATRLSEECTVAFILYGCIWLFLSLLMDYTKDRGNMIYCLILHIVLGVLLSFVTAMHPIGRILLLAVVLSLVGQKLEMPDVPANQVPVIFHLVKSGWMRIFLIVIPYVVISGIMTTNIELLTDQSLPRTVASYGYSLLAGLNGNSQGAENEEDMNLLYQTMDITGSAVQAQQACQDLAVSRLTGDPLSLLNLLWHKFILLWQNDDASYMESIIFWEEQDDNLLAADDLFSNLRDVNSVIYVVTIFFGLPAVINGFRRKGSHFQILPLFFMGSVVIYLFMESSNQSHYFLLPFFMIMAGLGIRDICMGMGAGDSMAAAGSVIEREGKQRLEKLYAKADEEIKKLREEALANVFDMQYALEHGNVVMTVSPAFGGGGSGQASVKIGATQPNPRQQEQKKPEETDGSEAAVEEAADVEFSGKNENDSAGETAVNAQATASAEAATADESNVAIEKAEKDNEALAADTSASDQKVSPAESVSEEELGKEQIKAAEIIIEDVITEEIIERDVITEEDITAGDITEEDITEEGIIEEGIVEEDITAEDITAGDITEEDITEEDITAGDIEEDITEESIIEEDITAEDITAEDNETDDILIKNIIAEKSSSAAKVISGKRMKSGSGKLAGERLKTALKMDELEGRENLSSMDKEESIESQFLTALRMDEIENLFPAMQLKEVNHPQQTADENASSVPPQPTAKVKAAAVKKKENGGMDWRENVRGNTNPARQTSRARQTRPEAARQSIKRAGMPVCKCRHCYHHRADFNEIEREAEMEREIEMEIERLIEKVMERRKLSRRRPIQPVRPTERVYRDIEDTGTGGSERRIKSNHQCLLKKMRREIYLKRLARKKSER